MAIRFRCRSCGKLLSIGTRKAGQEVRCPICSRQQQVPWPGPPLAGPFSLPTRESHPRWTRMWDLTFGLALTAGGLAMVLIVFWAISPPVSLASIKRAPTIRPSRIAAAAPQNQGDWVCSKVAKTAPEPITKKLVAIVPANAPKHSVAAEVEVVKVRPAPGQEAETPKKHPPAPVAFSMKRRQNRSEEELRRELLQVAEVSLPRQVPVRQGNLGQPTFVIAGLPWRRGADCRLGKEPAENLQLFSQRIRTFFQQDSGDRADCLRQKLFADEESCRSPEAIPA